jgi:acid phosphatase (class A)
LILATLLALPTLAQAPQHKYLVPTSNYLHADTVDLSALPEPPRPGSLAARADLEAILQLQAWRTPEQVAFAKRVDHLEAFDGAEALGPWFTRERLPLTARLLEEALGDGEAMNLAAKLRFKRLRPPLQDPRVQPCTPVRMPEVQPPPASFYSYPSGHATSIHLLAGLLEELVPERKEAVQAWAHRAAWSRMIAGVHFPSDAVGGELLAGITLNVLKTNPAFREALERCKAEVVAARSTGPH